METENGVQEATTPETTETAAPSTSEPEGAQPEGSQGSEPQTNTEPEGGDNPKKMVPIPSDKWRAINQQIREQKEKLAQYEQPLQPQQPPTQPQQQGQSAFDQLAGALSSHIQPQIAAQNQVLEEIQRDKAIQEVQNKPYAEELAEDIARFYLDPGLGHLPVSQRMDQAYKLAVGENIERLTQQATQGGQEAAYQKIAEKQSEEGVSPSGGKRLTGNVLDDIGKMSSADYEKNRAQIFAEMGLGDPHR